MSTKLELIQTLSPAKKYHICYEYDSQDNITNHKNAFPMGHYKIVSIADDQDYLKNLAASWYTVCLDDNQQRIIDAALCKSIPVVSNPNDHNFQTIDINTFNKLAAFDYTQAKNSNYEIALKLL